VRERGPSALHHLWSSPQALPTLAEIQDPAAWLAREMPRELEEPRHTGSSDAAA